MTYDDVPEIKVLYPDNQMNAFTLRYQLHKAKLGKKVLIYEGWRFRGSILERTLSKLKVKSFIRKDPSNQHPLTVSSTNISSMTAKVDTPEYP